MFRNARLTTEKGHDLMLAPKLHLLCGKIASGKSTLAKSIATKHSAILLSEDQWLSRLY
ncbi:AAA family ATPase, partial [Pseudomonas syringae]|uniref:AAA family ATPase n=1 Tax=Pseudomonas syringae TaxID=317 RepID=UPI001F3CA974